MTIVKIRRARSGTGGMVTSVTVPKAIADAMEQVGVEAFDVSLTEEGIVLRPVKGEPTDTLPAWLKVDAEGQAARDAAFCPDDCIMAHAHERRPKRAPRAPRARASSTDKQAE